MEVWIQRHDLSHSDLHDGTIESAKRALFDFDWESELQKLDRADQPKDDVCPPGIGFVSDDKRILHIMPSRRSLSNYHYHFPERKKLLGLFSITQEETVTVMDLPDEYRETIIERHYEGKHEVVLDLLRSHGTKC